LLVLQALLLGDSAGWSILMFWYFYIHVAVDNKDICV